MRYKPLSSLTELSKAHFAFPVFIRSMQVVVGIISSLIVFPINLIVVQIFRNVRPKPKIKPKTQKPSPPALQLSFTEENLENYNQLKESSDESAKGSNNSLDSAREKNNRTRLSINDVHTDVDRASFTDSPLLIDRRLSTTFEIGKKEREFSFLPDSPKVELNAHFPFIFISSDISCTSLTVVVQKEEYSTSLLRVCGLVFAVCFHHWVCCGRHLLRYGVWKHQVSSVAVFVLCVIRAGCVRHTATQGTNERFIKSYY